MASSKLKQASVPQLEEAGVDMSPMIDMVFLLLIFFMVNAVIIDYQKDKDVVIPTAAEAKAPTDVSSRIVINIFNNEKAEERGGRYATESGKVLSEDELKEHVRKLREVFERGGSKTASLHIRADREAPVEYTKRAVKAAAIPAVIFSSYTSE